MDMSQDPQNLPRQSYKELYKDKEKKRQAEKEMGGQLEGGREQKWMERAGCQD